MPETRKADAVKVPKAMAGGGDLAAKLSRLDAIARPLLGLDDKAPTNCPYPCSGPHDFVRPAAGSENQTLLFPKGHARQGEERYAWVDRGDGVLLGFLKPDEPDPAPVAPPSGQLAQNMAEAAKLHPFLAENPTEG